MTKSHPEISWLGNPPTGSISAVAVTDPSSYSCLIGSGIGLSQVITLPGIDKEIICQRLPGSPAGIFSIGISPEFDLDHLILVGTNRGIFRSSPSGKNWELAPSPFTDTILCLAVSPQFSQDGFALAGSLESGILSTSNRGSSWEYRSFGLFDLSIFCLAFSPTFLRDGIVFAGTESTIYFSYNHAKAWKELPFPADTGPVLSLALSPAFPDNSTLFAGTETNGLWRSLDKGQHWEGVPLPARCINSLVALPGNDLLAATENGIYLLSLDGAAWCLVCEVQNAICLAAHPGLAIAGTVEDGAWISEDFISWRKFPQISSRTFTGMEVIPSPLGSMVFIHGIQDGVWRIQDHGETWEDITSLLNTQAVVSLCRPWNQEMFGTLLAATDAGILLSKDYGASWKTLLPGPSQLVTCSASGEAILAYQPGIGIKVSLDSGSSWEIVNGEWERNGRVIALKITQRGFLLIAHLEGIGENISLYQGTLQSTELVQQIPAGKNPVVSFWIPEGAVPDRVWFAAMGNRIYRFSQRRGGNQGKVVLTSPSGTKVTILELTGSQDDTGMQLFALSPEGVFHAQNWSNWSLITSFRDERALAMVPDIRSSHSASFSVLFLGGSVGTFDITLNRGS